jgi:hypothetical protein
MNPYHYEEHAHFIDFLYNTTPPDPTSQQLTSPSTTAAKPSQQPSERDVGRFFVQIKALMALRHKKNDSQPAQITEHVYLGSIGAALSKETLTTLGITHILICAETLKPAFPKVSSTPTPP